MSEKSNGFVRIPRWAVGLAATLLLGLLSFAIVWGMYKSKVSENTSQIHVLQKDVNNLKKMRMDIAVIKNDVSWIKGSLSSKKRGDK